MIKYGGIENTKKQAITILSNWIEVIDPKSKWTIEDFPYKTGVDENKTKHCWKCVTVNRCWFKNEEEKRPKEFDYSKYSLVDIPLKRRGLYHPRCHCIKYAKENPNISDVRFIIPSGKIDWMIKDKGHTLLEMGYKDDDYLDVVEILKNLIANEYIKGNYIPRLHDETGFKVSFILNNFPGKNEDFGKNYKVKTGWTIFPDLTLKCNTLIGGLKK